MGNIPSNEVRINSGLRGVRTERYKLAYERRGKIFTGLLYDLKADPYKMKNIYSKAHPQVSLLTPRLKHWLKKTGDGFVLEDR